MSQQATITVFDGAATPVSHTLNPKDNKTLPDGTRLAVWRESLAGLPDMAQVRVEIYERTLKSGVVQVRTRVVVPVMESVSGVNALGYTASPKVAYEDVDEHVKYKHPRATITGKRLCTQILRNLLSNVSVTTPAVSAGVVDEAAVQGLMPT